jgi:hypothetical protein
MVSGLITVFRMTPFSYARSGFAYSFTRNLSDRLRGISEVAVRQPSKLEIENHGLGICLPAPPRLLADWSASVLCLVKQ